MLQYFIDLRFLFFILCISQKFSLNLSETNLYCYNEKIHIACKNPNTYLIIRNSTFGYFKYFKHNSVSSHWCSTSNSSTFSHNCKISLLNRIAKICSGAKSCYLNVIFSKYIPKELFPCKELFAQNQLLSLYIEYECVTKELFINVADLNSVQFVGGYLTSVAYINQKTNDNYDFKVLAASYAAKKLLPIKVSFRPTTLIGKQGHFPIVFQFQILENTLYPYQNNAILSNFTNTCQMGKLYSQDYYAFNPDRYLLSNETSNDSIIICQSSPDLVGKLFQIQNATSIFIIGNVNFDNPVKRNEGLLIKYSAIFCPLLNITNAKISYDNKITQSRNLNVNVFARVECISGYFFLSSNLSQQTSLVMDCDHNKGEWNRSIIPDQCVNKSTTKPAISPVVTIADTTRSTVLAAKWESTQTTSSTNMLPTAYMNESSRIPVSVLSIKNSEISLASKCILIILSIIIIILCVSVYVCLKNQNKIKCLSKNCISLSKLFNKHETIHMNGNSTFGNHFEGFINYHPVNDHGTPMSGSLRYMGHSSSESYRQSNRTLLTRADSKPTMTSRESFPTSNNVSEFDIHNIHHQDELPTKVPKQSPIMKILRSASSLKNQSLGVFRPMSLSRQSFNDRSSIFYDPRSSNSQIALLKSRRNNIASEFIDVPPVMWTSDISPSKTMPKSNMPYKRDSEFSNNSNSDLSIRYNSKIYSPTVDTYLEPTLEVSNHLDEDYSQKLSSQNEKNKNEDYMIYDHSRVSSNNIDFTESGSDINTNENEENKRFSMISNNYYGLPSSNCNPHSVPSRIYDPITERINNNSRESVYETIDEDPICQNTLERRNLALPPPPNE